MAKLHKVQFYLLDYNDDFKGAQDLASYLESNIRYGLIEYVDVSTKDIGEFYDEHPLNYTNCPEAEFEKYFKENNQC